MTKRKARARAQGSDASVPPDPAGDHGGAPVRGVKSFRLRDDLSHQIAILAAQERRKIYEVLEEALEEYLARRGRR